jgi:hypothetical protein
MKSVCTQLNPLDTQQNVTGLTSAVAFRLRFPILRMAFISGLATVTTGHLSIFHRSIFHSRHTGKLNTSHSALHTPFPQARMPLAKAYPSHKAVKCHSGCETMPLHCQAVSLLNSLALLQWEQQMGLLHVWLPLWAGAPNWSPRLK